VEWGKTDVKPGVKWDDLGCEWGGMGGGLVGARYKQRAARPGKTPLTAEDPKEFRRGNPGVESCKSIFFGVDPGEGVQGGGQTGAYP
jgi:hypothetical protein